MQTASTPLDPPVSSEAQPAKAHLPASWHLASGALSGAASVLVLQPLDLIKTRIQQEPAAGRAVEPATGGAAAGEGGARSARPRGTQVKIWQTAKTVVRTDGVQGLWRGTGPTLYRNVPGVSLYFFTLSRLRSLLGRSAVFRAGGAPSPPAGGKAKLTPTGDLLVGSVARTGVGFILMPFTLLKTISESTVTLPASAAVASSSSSATATLTRPSTPSTLTALRTLYASGGIRSLWRGAVPTALRDAPGAGLFIVFYERGRRFLGVRGDGGGGAVGGGMAGAAASLASTLLTTPFDLLKTRRQLSPTQYTSLLSSVQLVYRTSGLRGFWEGGGLRVVRKAGSAGIGWAVYEAFVGVGEKRVKGEKDRVLKRSGGG